MKLIVSNSSSVPIYEQIEKEIIRQILKDELKEGEALPSIRSLAKDIRISVMTIKKAYDELERDGYIITRAGKGSFVAPKNSDFILEQKRKEIEDYISKIAEISKVYNISKEEILEVFDLIYGSDDE